jgi:two-component system NtrC family response regulator/two-component system nitrogen regulation response regulator GlnG
MGKILVVDDERSVLAAFEEILGGSGHEISTARRAEPALAKLEAESFDLLILDIRMPGMSGLDALDRVRATHPKLPVIVITGQGTVETAIEATKRGAFDYHLKPFEPSDMLQTVDRALEAARLMKGQVTFGAETAAAAGDSIIGLSPPMQEVYKAIGRVARTEATVLIRGESGTGKELVARAIYQHSLRRDKPLQVVNCAAIPETLLESELFGHERGAFTGATHRRVGKFEQAHQGTIFLDEVGDISPAIQAKILRVLQEKSFERLGSNETVRTDVRVLAATNRNLEEAIVQGAFREDLYHRLNVVTIQMPPLRDRKEDIPQLVDSFLDRFAEELGTDRPALSEDALELLKNHSWPGNVRELQHCIHRTVIFTRGHAIQAADLRPLFDRADEGKGGGPPAKDDETLAEVVWRYLSFHEGPRAYDQFIGKVEKLLLTEALRRAKGNQTHAARLLGMPRPTLHAKLQKHGLDGHGGGAER